MTKTQAAGLLLYEMTNIEANLTGRDCLAERIADSLQRAKRAIEYARRAKVIPAYPGDAE